MSDITEQFDKLGLVLVEKNEIERLRAENESLREALLIAKESILSCSLEVPITREIIDEALREVDK